MDGLLVWLGMVLLFSAFTVPEAVNKWRRQGENFVPALRWGLVLGIFMAFVASLFIVIFVFLPIKLLGWW